MILLQASLKKSNVHQNKSLELFLVHAQHSLATQITEKSALLGLTQVDEGVKGEAKIHPAGSESHPGCRALTACLCMSSSLYKAGRAEPVKAGIVLPYGQ